jgi:hypothetical protein
VLEMTSSLDALKQRSISALSWLCKACVWTCVSQSLLPERQSFLHGHIQHAHDLCCRDGARGEVTPD